MHFSLYVVVLFAKTNYHENLAAGIETIRNAGSN